MHSKNRKRAGHVTDLHINGAWIAAHDGAEREIFCPADGTLVKKVDEAGPADAQAAIDAARSAFDSGWWTQVSVIERGVILERAADLIEERLEQFAHAESMDTGKRIVEARYDIADSIRCIRYFAQLGPTFSGRSVDTGDSHIQSRVQYEPVGVAVLITPWNYPLLQAVWKVAPAIAAGCTFVLKPSELTPSTSIMFMQALVDAGLPPGVGNLVLGAGTSIGETLTSSSKVDMVSFTGGLETGKRVMASAAATIKKVALELGGKNPNIIFADADLEAALDNALTAIFLHSGQVCSAGSRLIIEQSIHDSFVPEFVERAKKIRLGGPFDDSAETGALISEAHRNKVHTFVEKGLSEGATLLCGGEIPEGPGYFYPPTILANCTTHMSCVQDESFGPVVTIETFTTEEQAIALANDTYYGLAGAVWTQNAGKSQRVANALRHGTIWINDFHPYVPQAEWGGFKQSGIGRELGPNGLLEYLEAKHVYHNTSPAPSGWFGA